MTFVVIAKRLNMILPIVEQMEGVYVVKTFKAKAYCLYVGPRPLEDVMREIVKTTAAKYGGVVMVNVFEIYNEVTDIALSDSAGKLKYVSPEDSIVQNARALGISFGDE